MTASKIAMVDGIRLYLAYGFRSPVVASFLMQRLAQQPMAWCQKRKHVVSGKLNAVNTSAKTMYVQRHSVSEAAAALLHRTRGSAGTCLSLRLLCSHQNSPQLHRYACLFIVYDMIRMMNILSSRRNHGCQEHLSDQKVALLPSQVGIMDFPFTTAIAFIPNSGDNQVLVGTGSHKLWLYDARAGKRPQLDVSWRDARVTCLAAEPSGGRVWAANGQGYVEVLELAASRMHGAMKGAGGSIRSLSLHPEEPLVAAVGLDRYMRVFSTTTRKQLCKTYLKQQLTGVVFAPLPALPASSTAQQSAAGLDVASQPAAVRPSTSDRPKKSKKSKTSAVNGHADKGQGDESSIVQGRRKKHKH